MKNLNKTNRLDGSKLILLITSIASVLYMGLTFYHELKSPIDAGRQSAQQINKIGLFDK